jgi:hypothetical protein
MSRYRKLAIAVAGMCALTLVPASSRGNELSEADASAVKVFFNRAVAMHRDIVESTGLLIRTRDFTLLSEEPRRTWFCLNELGQASESVAQDLRPLVYLVDLSVSMEDKADELLSLMAAESALSTLTSNIATTRNSLNSTLVSCRQSQLAYDKAKLLANFADDLGKAIEPILARVKSSFSK